jgi:hypothetical protein
MAKLDSPLMWPHGGCCIYATDLLGSPTVDRISRKLRVVFVQPPLRTQPARGV